MEPPVKTYARATRISFLVVAALFAVGCGSDSNSSSSSTAVDAAATTPTSGGGSSATTVGGSDGELCAARDSLKSSVEALATAVTGIASTGTSGVQTAIDKVTADLASVKQLAKADVAPQVTATETALTDLRTAVTNAASSGIGGVVTAATAFATSATTLLADLSSLKCS